ncbi:MAG: hypothetical protein IJZ65_06715 [Ruminiclostridium sp.]|nr:hypothetical protein [Ruminiclostridium sp.]
MKKSRFLRKLVSVFLAGTMILNGVTASGETGGLEEQTISLESINDYLNNELPLKLKAIDNTRSTVQVKEYIWEYVEKTLPVYLSDYQTEVKEYDISDLIPIHNWTGADSEKYLVVVSDSNKMFGTLTVEYIDNNIISAFRKECITKIETAINEKTAFQIGYSNGCFMIYESGKFSIIENPDFVEENFLSELVVNENNTKVYSLSDVITAYPLSSRSTVVQNSTAVPNVSNADHPDLEDKGLCWAACVASMAMHAGKTSSITAISVYNACVNIPLSGKPNTDYPIGSTEWVLFACNSIYGMGIVDENTYLQAYRVVNLLGLNKPILCYFSRSQGNHAMVLFKCEATSDSSRYYFMDPGGSSSGAGTVNAIVTNTSSINLTSRNGHTYSTWYRSFYKS